MGFARCPECIEAELSSIFRQQTALHVRPSCTGPITGGMCRIASSRRYTGQPYFTSLRFHVMQITCMSIFMSIWTSVLFMFLSHRPLSLYGAIKPGLKPHRGAWER